MITYEILVNDKLSSAMVVAMLLGKWNIVFDIMLCFVAGLRSIIPTAVMVLERSIIVYLAVASATQYASFI